MQQGISHREENFQFWPVRGWNAPDLGWIAHHDLIQAACPRGKIGGQLSGGEPLQRVLHIMRNQTLYIGCVLKAELDTPRLNDCYLRETKHVLLRFSPDIKWLEDS